jgi:hypothetical protein
MKDAYNTNITMVYDNKSIDLIDTNEELPNFAGIARNIQNRSSHHVGSELKEARLFRKFFRTSVRVVKILWELVVCNKLRPRGRRLEHLLWALYFMKVYPKQGPGCWSLAHLPVLSTQRPITNGSGRMSRQSLSSWIWW